MAAISLRLRVFSTLEISPPMTLRLQPFTLEANNGHKSSNNGEQRVEKILLINLGSSAPVTNSCFLPLSSCFFFVLPENLLRCCSDLLHHCDQPGNMSVEVTYSNSGASQSLGNTSVSPCPSLPSFSAVVLRVWPLGQQPQCHLGTCQGCRLLGPTLDLLSGKLRMEPHHWC